MPKLENAPLNQSGQHVNENFTDSYYGPSNILQEPLVDVRQAVYNLSEMDYMKIRKGDNAAAKYSWEFFIISAGYLVILVAKYFVKAKIEKWEFYSALIAIGLFIILHWLADRFLPSDKKKVLDVIHDYFKKNQPTYETRHKKQ